jgi:hypothetical protein
MRECVVTKFDQSQSLSALQNFTLVITFARISPLPHVGTHESLVKQYAGVLTVHTVLHDSCSCMKPGDAGLTSWIEFVELRLVVG